MDKSSSEEVLRDWRSEILGYLKEMGSFKEIDDPLLIMKMLSGFSARATYMNNLSANSKNRQIIDFRVEELVPFLKETDFQFRIWSRIGSLNTHEWEMSKG
jgi:hypothetical protein